MVPEGLNALRETSQLSVEISELLRHPGTSRHFAFTEEVDGLGLEIGRVQPALDFDLELASLVEGILVSGHVRGLYQSECIRCLRSFVRPFDVELSEVMAYEELPGAEDGYVVSGEHALLEPVVRDAVVLAMPLNPLCRPDCKGLCPVCGADRNATDCGHDTARIDLRWEPLSRLKETLEE
ncbi:MAG: DUF177 domain-containing protein [Actinobacteria bacterium]|nr:MAG: DUF177 domain-containing protein [Actinomycetota bacterium]